MKKKVLALCLVLALTLAMMVPVFAASNAVDHTHMWIQAGESKLTQPFGSVTHHYVYTYYYRQCTDCGQHELYNTTRVEVPHTVPCAACGMGS